LGTNGTPVCTKATRPTSRFASPKRMELRQIAVNELAALLV
jgi:hypothetical protein